MRTAHITASLETGGKERTIAQLCANDASASHLAVTFEPGRAPAAFASALNIKALDRTSSDFLPALARLLTAERIEIIHAHGPVAAIYAARARSAGQSLVVTIHADMITDWRAAIPIWQALRRADAISAVSDDLAGQVRRFAGRRCAIIPSAVDTTRFHPRQDGARSGGSALRTGTAGRLHKVKRHADLIAAMRRLHCAARLVIAGEGPQRARLSAMTEGHYCRLAGNIDDMPSFYRSLDMFVLCSAHEGSPLALLEAMASGLPVIAVPVGGIKDIASGEEHGVVFVRPRSPGAIAAAIDGLAADPVRRRRLSRAGAVRAQQFGLAAQRLRYDTLYEAAQK